MNLKYMAFVVNKTTYLFLCFESTKIKSPLLIKLRAYAIQVEATDTKHHRLGYVHDGKELCCNSKECNA